MRYRKYINKFIKELKLRLNKGYREYGDESFDRPTKDLINEIQEELLDVAGWGLILWAKLEEIKEK